MTDQSQSVWAEQPGWPKNDNRDTAEMFEKRKEIREKYNQLSKEGQSEIKGYRYSLHKGNNHKIVLKVLQTR